MNIDRIELWHVAVPLVSPVFPVAFPGLKQTTDAYTLVRVFAEGHEGLAAVPALGLERAGLGELLSACLLGERADDLSSIRARLREIADLGQEAGFVEAACYDLLGKAKREPVYKLLGGEAGALTLGAVSTEARSLAERVAFAEAKAGEGFTLVEVPVDGDSLTVDVAALEALKRAVGRKAELAVSAYQDVQIRSLAKAARWSHDRAVAFCRAAASAGVRWVDEPLPREDRIGLARLAKIGAPIALGRRLSSAAAEPYLVRGLVSVARPDPLLCGGLTEAYGVMRFAHRLGRAFAPHAGTNALSLAAAAHVAAASPDRAGVRLLVGARSSDAVLSTTAKIKGGKLFLSEASGLGVHLDARGLAKYGQKLHVASRVRSAVKTFLSGGPLEVLRVDRLRAERLSARATELSRSSGAGLVGLRTALLEVEPPVVLESEGEAAKLAAERADFEARLSRAEAAVAAAEARATAAEARLIDRGDDIDDDRPLPSTAPARNWQPSPERVNRWATDGVPELDEEEDLAPSLVPHLFWSEMEDLGAEEDQSFFWSGPSEHLETLERQPARRTGSSLGGLLDDEPPARRVTEPARKTAPPAGRAKPAAPRPPKPRRSP